MQKYRWKGMISDMLTKNGAKLSGPYTKDSRSGSRRILDSLSYPGSLISSFLSISFFVRMHIFFFALYRPFPCKSYLLVFTSLLFSSFASLPILLDPLPSQRRPVFCFAIPSTLSLAYPLSQLTFTFQSQRSQTIYPYQHHKSTST